MIIDEIETSEGYGMSWDEGEDDIRVGGSNQGGHDSVDFSLNELLAWISENRPELLRKYLDE